MPLTDLSGRMAEYLPAGALALIDRVTEAARKKRKRLYLVGGVVRDLLLGRPCLDIDLVLEGDAINLSETVGADGGACKLTVHPAFGTATLKGDGFALDLVTARRETYSRPGALPEVTPSNLNDDLYRRDFTVNAMAIPLTGRQRGRLIDPWGGQADIENRLIRVLHDNSFVDDATRILRAMRYEQRLAFKLEDSTEFLLKRDVSRLDTISGDRIRHELDRIFEEQHPELVLHRGGQFDVWKRLHPALKGNNWIADSFHRAREMLRPTPIALYYALFLYRLNEDEASQALNRLDAPKLTTKVVLDTVTLKDSLGPMSADGLKASQIYSDLRDLSGPSIIANIIASPDPAVSKPLTLYLEKLRYVKPCLRGDDLVRMGASPGPAVGELLSKLHRAKLDGEVSNKADEVKMVRTLLPGHAIRKGKRGKRK
ncbi:MAG: hypothetical protein Q7T05_03210 [Dehalococcoidia bacterium]|nr:hypothetical protein [Dehalococcoidia bacterium]